MKIATTLLLVFLALNSFGQDAVYSQFWTGQNMLNPATSGHMDSDYKGYAKYKSQWASITDAFRTMGAGGEYRLFNKPKNPSYLGVGLFVIQDQAGSSDLKRLQIEGSASYQLKSGPYNHFAAGIGISYFQRSISYEGLLWDSQFNGTGADPTLASGEDFTSDKTSSIDASLGGLWEHNKKRHYQIGLSWKHFIQPQGLLNGQADQWIPMQAFTGTYFSDFNHFDIDYHLLVTRQGGAMQYTGGALLHYRFGADSRYTKANTSNQVIAGIMHRYQDAWIPVIGYEYGRTVTVLFSYDLNTSRLRDASNLRGGMEVSLIYQGNLISGRRKLR